MRDWRTRLEDWARVWGRLNERSRDCFPMRPPADGWPRNLAQCPALTDLYDRCDGGEFGPYHLRPAAELSDEASEVWLHDPEPGRWVRIGDHEYGHAVLWDAHADEVALYSPDDGEPEPVGRTEVFFTQLFNPSEEAAADATKFWAETLVEADGLASSGTT